MNKSFKTLMMGLSVSLALCSVSANAADPEFSLSLAHSAETNHPWHPASEKFIELVEKNSNGRIEFNSLFSAGEMGSEREMAEGLQQGTLDMILIATMGMSSFDKNLMIYDFPYLFPSFEKAYQVLDGKVGQMVSDSLEKKGFHVLAYLENDYRGFSNNSKPIHHPSDLAGLKLRVPESPVFVAWMKSINANPTIMPYNEVYSALQTGVVDGQDNGILLSYTHKVFEVQKYYSLTNHIYCPSPLMISTRVWNELPDDLKDVMTKAAVEVRDYQRKLNAEYRAKYEKAAVDEGVQLNALSDTEMQEFVDSAKKVWPEFANVVDKDIYDAMMQAVE